VNIISVSFELGEKTYVNILHTDDQYLLNQIHVTNKNKNGWKGRLPKKDNVEDGNKDGEGKKN
jgi:hypothetical protein